MSVWSSAARAVETAANRGAPGACVAAEAGPPAARRPATAAAEAIATASGRTVLLPMISSPCSPVTLPGNVTDHAFCQALETLTPHC
ncbi:hypothetical protein SGPA1_40473 [Streptomyces misionensis JCM 4497]